MYGCWVRVRRETEMAVGAGKRNREIVRRGEDERHLPRQRGGTSGVRQTSATEWCFASRVTVNKPQGIQMVSRQSFGLKFPNEMVKLLRGG